MKRKLLTTILLMMLAIAFFEVFVKIEPANAFANVSTFETGWNGWENDGNASSYQRGTDYHHGGGSYSVYTSSQANLSVFYINKTFTWGSGDVNLTAWAFSFKSSDASLALKLDYQNGTVIQNWAWVEDLSYLTWSKGTFNLTELENEVGELNEKVVCLYLETQWYDAGNDTQHSGLGGIDDIIIGGFESESFFNDDFEDGTLNKWTAMGGGIGFKISTTFALETYATESDTDLGDGMYKQLVSPLSTAYVTMRIYYNGSRTDVGDVRILSLFNSTSGRGVSIKHHLYPTEGNDVLQIFDEWNGTTTDSVHELAYNTWHKILLIVTSSNNTASLYIDDIFEASQIIDLSNNILDQLFVQQDDATWTTYYYRMWVDDVEWNLGETPPPSEEEVVNVSASPYAVGSVSFTINGSSHSTPYNENLTAGDWQFNATQLYPTAYHFDYWLINDTTNQYACINITISDATDLTIVYQINSYNVTISVSPFSVGLVSITVDGLPDFAPYNEYFDYGEHQFVCVDYQVYPNSSYVYTFDHWTVNGSGNYGSLSLTLNIQGDTDLTIVYLGSPISPPFHYIYARGALNATWYMRSDTHTIHAILGFKLLTENTHTPTFDVRIGIGIHNVTYGVRVWVIDIFNHTYELTSGSPIAIVIKSDIGGEMMVAYWNCPAYNSMIDSVLVNVYQRFDSEAWSLRRIFITKTNLLIRLPASTWTFHYYVIRTEGSTNSTFGFGSYTIYNSRINLQYYKANPWDVALARLWQRDFVKFMFTPWTYWLGDLFWTIILFGCIVMAYLRTGSLKPILGLLWILGGSGSILWALIPAAALHVAVLMLAVAMAMTYFRLVYK